MKKIIVFIIAIITACNINAQRMSTQQFMVRKITFNATDQVVPINGISVEINKAKFRSDKTGQFVANIPVSKDMGFYISNIIAPGYIVSIPEDLSKKIYLSSNQYVIVLADINAVKAERNRIYNNNKAALAKQEERLNIEVKKNQELLNKIEKQESEYNLILAELEKAKRQLESFNNAKIDIETKIDSLADNLSMIDYASLANEEQIRLEKEKEGEWIDAIVDEVISKLETNLSTNHRKELNELGKAINEISNDYYQKFIKGNQPWAINYFTYHYYDYLCTSVKEMRKKKAKVLDRIVDKIIEEDLEDIVRKNIDSCQNNWKVKEPDSNPNLEYVTQNNTKTLKSAKEEFLLWALYPEREEALYQVLKPEWRDNNFDKAIVNTLKNVYSDYYIKFKNVADKCVGKYKKMTKDELYEFSDSEKRALIAIEVEEEIRNEYNELWDNLPPQDFQFVCIDLRGIVVTESLEPIRKSYNELVNKDVENVKKASYKGIESMIQPISQENHYTDMLSWDVNNKIEKYNDQYIEFKKEYPEYTAFLYPIVMQFMQPIIKKYDCDEALYVWKSSMEDDVRTYCYRAIREYANKLSYIPNVAGSDNKCMDIVQVITEIEKEKLVINHNERIKRIKEAEAKEEQTAIANMKSNKKHFDKEEDIITFLATHKFVNEDFEMISWYNSKLNKYYTDYYGKGWVTSEDISCTIIEWSRNSAKLKLKYSIGSANIIVRVQLNSSSASYSESCGGETRTFSVIDR